jgi:NADH dehydrogenase FAD-containing subunit
VEAGAIRLADGATIEAETVVWAPGPAAHPFLRRSGLPVDEHGFVRVGPTLQAEGQPTLFAAGDCAARTDMPKAGVYAVRAGPVLAANLRASLSGGALRPFQPQRDFLSLLNLGDGTAIGCKRGLVVEGSWVFWLKDRIDRRFMARYR